MFLGGLWHGAEWKFALWGSLHGLLLALERLWGSVNRKDGESVSRKDGVSVSRNESEDPRHAADTCAAQRPNLRFTETLKHLLSGLLTFHIVTLLWLTFLMPDLESIVAFFKGALSGKTGFSGPPIFSLVFYGSAVVLYHLWGWLAEHRGTLAARLARSPLEPILHGVMLFLILTNPGAPRGFIYFQF